NLGSVPAGFHTYRIDRQAASSTSDVVNYYIDGVLVAQHTVGTLGALYVYASHNGGTGQTLDIDRVWGDPTYRSAGTFQSCAIDGGSNPFSWRTATWNASVPAGTTLQLSTRTSSDSTNWSSWSAPLTASGQNLTSPAARYIQYLMQFTTTD